MTEQQRKLLLDQLDRKLKRVQSMRDLGMPGEGWVYSIRRAIKMSLRQLGNRMNISPQSVKEIEQREKEGNITLKTLREAGDALDMDFYYVFIPRKESLEKMIEERTYQLARAIVLKTSNNMRLEDQEVDKKRLDQAIKSLAEDFYNKVPRNLWD
ncbi:MAG: mobile mystery protein A [Saprospiraceae bacterium]|nr:mobile mystery protein A [Saprospiraceae bacterium]